MGAAAGERDIGAARRGALSGFQCTFAAFQCYSVVGLLISVGMVGHEGRDNWSLFYETNNLPRKKHLHSLGATCRPPLGSSWQPLRRSVYRRRWASPGWQDSVRWRRTVVQVREYEEASASAKDRSDAAAMGPSQEVMRHWFPAVTARIQREQDEVRIHVCSVISLLPCGPACLLPCGPAYHSVIWFINTSSCIGGANRIMLLVLMHASSLPHECSMRSGLAAVAAACEAPVLAPHADPAGLAGPGRLSLRPLLLPAGAQVPRCDRHQLCACFLWPCFASSFSRAFLRDALLVASLPDIRSLEGSSKLATYCNTESAPPLPHCCMIGSSCDGCTHDCCSLRLMSI